MMETLKEFGPRYQVVLENSIPETSKLNII